MKTKCIILHLFPRDTRVVLDVYRSRAIKILREFTMVFKQIMLNK